MRQLDNFKKRFYTNAQRLWSRFFKTHKDIKLSLIVAVIVIAFGLFLGWDNDRTALPFPDKGLHYQEEPHNPLKFMASWDGADYIMIARDGYTGLFWSNWFPLYPIAIKVVGYIIPSLLDSALLIAWTSLVGAIYFYIKIVRRLFSISGDFEPLKAVFFFVLYPTAVFLIAPFSESIYALFALGSIYFAFQKKWVWAALLALLCAATHITGMLIVILVALILLEQKERLRNVIFTVITGSLGLLSYMAFLFFRFHKPLAFLESQQIYHGWTHASFLNLVTTASPFNVVSIILVVLSALYWWGRRRSFAIYSLLFLLILLIGRQYGGFNRYVLMAFPIPLMLYGYLRHKKELYPYVTALMGVVWAYFLLRYAGGYIGS